MARTLVYALFLTVVFYGTVAVAADETKSTVPTVMIIGEDAPDPLEKFNRGMFEFNRTVDQVFLEPVARSYKMAVPEWGRERVGSFLRNLSAPVDFVNSALQGDFKNSGTIFWRFVVNTMLGVGGLFDTAKDFGLEYRREDFDQTLAYHGVSSGPYLVLPLLGPTTTRGVVGDVVDAAINPFNYAEFAYVVSYHSTEVVHDRSELLDITDKFKSTAFDPYSSVKSAYFQRRDNAVRNGEDSEISEQ